MLEESDQQEDKKLKSLPKLSEETGVPLRTLQYAANVGNLETTKITENAYLSTLEAVHAWKANPKYHRGRNKKIST